MLLRLLMAIEFHRPTLISKIIMEDTGSCNGGNVNSYLQLN